VIFRIPKGLCGDFSMEDLLKKLDEIMAKNIVGKIGGLFCFIVVILSLAGFFVGAGSLLSSMKKPEAAVEAPAEEASEEEEETGEEAAEEGEETAEEDEEAAEEDEEAAEEDEETAEEDHEEHKE
jgi:cytoskeletal protein RodZ